MTTNLQDSITVPVSDITAAGFPVNTGDFPCVAMFDVHGSFYIYPRDGGLIILRPDGTWEFEEAPMAD